MISNSDEAVSNPVGSGTVIAVALVYYLLACILLVAEGPSLAALHAFAAFITLMIIAASNQLIPVLTGVAPTSSAQVIAVSTPLVAGFGLLILGFSGWHTFLPAAAILVLGALAWFVWITLRLVRVKLERPMAAIFVLATGAFAAAAAIGGGMAAGFESSRFGDVLPLAPVHAALAIGAFASAMIVAISYRFIPMFSLSHATLREAEKLPQWVVPLTVIGACLIFAKLGLGPLRIAAGIVFCALLLAVMTHGKTLRSRMRRRFDASIRYAMVAWAFGLISTALLAAGGLASLMTVVAVTCAVLGWISLSILGYAYKIVGFLAWETAKTRSSQTPLPPLGKALPERMTGVALWLLGIGTALTAVLTLTPLPIAIGTAIYLVGAVCAAAALLTLAWTYLRIPHGAHST